MSNNCEQLSKDSYFFYAMNVMLISLDLIYHVLWTNIILACVIFLIIMKFITEHIKVEESVLSSK